VAKRIVCFGDSWTYGSDLVDPALVPKLESEGYGVEDAEHKYFHENLPYREEHRYSNILQKALNCPVLNLSEPADSLIGMRVKFIEWIQQQPEDCSDTQVIFATTSHERYSFYSAKDKQWLSSGYLQYGDRHHPLVEHWKRHLVHSSSPELHDYTLLDFVMSSRALCKERNMKWVYAPVFPKRTQGNIDDKFVTEWSMMDVCTQRAMEGHKVWAWGEHPNELGHQFIAKYLISFMKECKLT
tara:strand:+ start:1560 stop:2282 length:723 start_codon:yes stop_codon:yes gene_type:complete